MIRRELVIFLIVGVAAVLVDFLTYHGLVNFQVMEVDIAKLTGFLTGTIFAYFGNRFWTFSQRSRAKGSAWRFATLYAFTLGANVLTNAISLKLLADMTLAFQVAFVLATGVSASLNFLGLRLFVFKSIIKTEFL